MATPPWLDTPGPIRPGEEIDQERLRSYLLTVLPHLEDQQLGVQQFPSGYSNLTYLIQVGGESMVLRRPPVGVKIATAHDMSREFKILSALHPVYRKVPEPLVFCGDSNVIGSPFYLMERVEGVILRRDINLAIVPSPELTSEIAGSLVDTLAELKDEHFGEANFVHVEVYDNPEEIQGDLSQAIITQAVTEWGFDQIPHWLNESWTYVLDSDGMVYQKFEGYVTLQELEEALQGAAAKG